jgi:hypothetical protein
MRKSPSIHWGWLALGMLGATAGTARATDLSVNPSVSLVPTMATTEPALQGTWQIACSIADTQTTYGWAGVSVYYSVTVGTANQVQIPNATGLLGTEAGSTTATGDLLVQGTLGGSALRPKFGGVFCHHGQQNSPLVDVWGQDVVVPPSLKVDYAYNPSRPNDPPSVAAPISADVVPDVPVGQPLAIHLDINAHPQGTESVELHYEGSGVHFTQVLHNITTDYQFELEKVTPLALGANLSVYAIFQPYNSKSNILQFHTVADPNAGSSSSSSSTGGTSGTGTGTGTSGSSQGVTTAGAPDPDHGGCSNAAGLDLAALLGIGALLARRRR